MDRPPIDELKKVIEIYEDGSVWEMIDVENYIDNLKSAGALYSAHGFDCKPVNAKEITRKFRKNEKSQIY